MEKLPRKILVIDDERDIREGCQRILTRIPLEVVTASNGQAGLDLLETEQPSIVICDIKMPGMDGIEVLSRVKSAYPDILVIMITGFSTVETAIEAMKKGAYDFISKPFTPDQLRIVVQRAVNTLHLTEESHQLKQERERNLADLQTEQSRIRTIIETLPNGVLVTNIAGQVVLMNPLAQEYLAVRQSDCMGKKIDACITDSGLCDYIRTVSTCTLPQSEELPSYELVLPEQRFILAQGRPVLGEDGACMGAVLTLSDITALKVFDRLKSEFVAKVSHELRSPLSIIHEQLAMVLKGNTPSAAKDSQYILGRAKEKTQTLISLIGDLLDISKIEAGKGEQDAVDIQVDELIAKIIEFVHPQARQKDQSILLEVTDAAIPALKTDPVALESIFGNLITNAIKYTPEGGKITVSIDVDNDAIQVKVADTGYGIEEKHLSKIFEKFYRIKDENTRLINGTGLGLSIVKSLIDSMHGQITVESKPKTGTTFTVTLPCKPH